MVSSSFSVLPEYIQKVNDREYLVSYEVGELDVEWMVENGWLGSEDEEPSVELFEKYEREQLPQRVVDLLVDEGIKPSHSSYSFELHESIMDGYVRVYKVRFLTTQ